MFKSSRNLKVHHRTHTGEKPFECSHCHKRFSQQGSLYRHMLWHQMAAARQSELTSVLTAYEVCSSETHRVIKESNDERPSVCEHCTKQFKNRKNLKVHQRTHTGEKPFDCNKCEKRFSQQGILNRHIQSHKTVHNALRNQRQFVCECCTKCFKTSHHLKVHRRIHTGEKPFGCGECKRQFSQWSILYRHMRCHESLPKAKPKSQMAYGSSSTYQNQDSIFLNGNPEKQHCCMHCSKDFKNARNLVIHMRIHSGEKPYTCFHCNKSFSQNSILYNHLRSHNLTKMYACTVCNRQFTRKSNLQLHARCHSGEKPYSCAVCSKRFALSGSVAKHMVLHSDEKPFACTICEKKFKHSSYLKSHMRCHTGETPYACTVCSKTFRYASSMSVHKRRHEQR